MALGTFTLSTTPARPIVRLRWFDSINDTASRPAPASHVALPVRSFATGPGLVSRRPGQRRRPAAPASHPAGAAGHVYARPAGRRAGRPVRTNESGRHNFFYSLAELHPQQL